jgi:hypothetical protein
MSRILESHTRRLSLAICLIDNYANKPPLGAVNISLKYQKYKATGSPSGYYVFLNLPDETYTVQARSDFYFDEDVEVTPSSLNLLNPVKKIWLKPNPAYPFPLGATLIRGLVLDSNKKTVSDAMVEITGKNIKTVTSEKGEFVLCFPPLKETEIIKENGKRFVKGNGNKKIHIKATHLAGLGETDIEVEEGSTSIKYIQLA